MFTSRFNIKFSAVICLVAAACALQLRGQVPEQPQTTTNANDQLRTTADRKTMAFLKEAARDNDAEVGLAEVGASRAENAELKSYCEMLRKDHTQANKDLGPLATKYGVSINQPLPRKDEKEMAKFEKLNGQEFDQKFAEQMLLDHEKAINKYEKALKNVEAPDVTQYAETMLPKLRQHFQKGVEIARAVGVDDSTISSISKKLPAVGGTGESFESGKSTGEGKTQPGTPREQEPK